MKLPDLNLLLYAVDRSSAWHAPARQWWEGLLTSGEPVAMGWSVLLGFVRLSTRSQVFQAPLTSDQALDLVEGWLTQPAVRLVAPGPRHTALLRGLLRPLGTGGNLTTDAHLAALAIEHGAELCSADTDFARFPGLRWMNPIIA